MSHKQHPNTLYKQQQYISFKAIIYDCNQWKLLRTRMVASISRWFQNRNAWLCWIKSLLSRICTLYINRCRRNSFWREVKAIEVALLNLIPRIHNFNETVILINYKAEIQAATWNITPTVSTIIEYRLMDSYWHKQ